MTECVHGDCIKVWYSPEVVGREVILLDTERPYLAVYCSAGVFAKFRDEVKAGKYDYIGG